jgi:deoxyribonuclease-4
MRIGFHVSISGSVDRSVDRAKELGCTTFQIFTRNPRSWASREIGHVEAEAFKAKLSASGIEPVFAHMPYILNLASTDRTTYRRSVSSLEEELRRCRLLHVPYIVTHLGSHLGSGQQWGRMRVVKALRTVLSDSDGPMVLLENGSGSGNQVGSDLEEISAIFNGVELSRIGFCFDTCHAFAARYELRTSNGLSETIDEIDRSIGLDRIRLVHLNDSVGSLGSGVDRHEHIGLGSIGEEGFRLILHSEIACKPMVMETPVDERRGNQENMRKALELAV